MDSGFGPPPPPPPAPPPGGPPMPGVPLPGPGSIPPRDFGGLFAAAFDLYRQHWQALFTIVAVIMVPLTFLQNFIVYREGDYQFNSEFSYCIDTEQFDQLIADGEAYRFKVPAPQRGPIGRQPHGVAMRFIDCLFSRCRAPLDLTLEEDAENDAPGGRPGADMLCCGMRTRALKSYCSYHQARFQRRVCE